MVLADTLGDADRTFIVKVEARDATGNTRVEPVKLKVRKPAAQ
jgi:hypothetical protein